MCCDSHLDVNSSRSVGRWIHGKILTQAHYEHNISFCLMNAISFFRYFFFLISSQHIALFYATSFVIHIFWQIISVWQKRLIQWRRREDKIYQSSLGSNHHDTHMRDLISAPYMRIAQSHTHTYICIYIYKLMAHIHHIRSNKQNHSSPITTKAFRLCFNICRSIWTTVC